MENQSDVDLVVKTKKKRNKIAICVSSTWVTYRAFSPCGFLLYKIHEGFDHFVIDPNGGDDQVQLINYIKSEYDCIISCEYSWQKISNYSGLKIVIVDDLHRWGRHRVRFDGDVQAWANMIFSTYHFTDSHPNYPGSVPTETRRKYVYFPHFTMDIPEELPEYEQRGFAVVPGASVENFYPVRALAKRLPNIDFPGNNGLQELSRKDFILQLSKFKVAITCNLTLKYVVAKYFEIPMAGTALIASDIPHPLEKYLLGFDKSNSFFIPFSKEEDIEYIGRIAEHIASDREQWIKMTRNGRDLVRSRHTSAHRYDYLYSIITRVLSGKWSIQDQYDHLVASWSLKESPIEFTQKHNAEAVSSISDSNRIFSNVLILEPSTHWWGKFFSLCSRINGKFITSNSRIHLQIPQLNYLDQEVGIYASLVRIKNTFSAIVLHKDLVKDQSFIEYIMLFLEQDGCLYIVCDDDESASENVEEIFSDARGNITLFRDKHVINIRHVAKNTLSPHHFSNEMKERISNFEQVSEIFIIHLFKEFWDLVIENVELIIGNKVLSVLDDRFWIEYGALRIWTSDDARGSARVNLEGICHEHAYIGIQSVDYEENFFSYREKIDIFCKSRGLLKSTGHFIGYEQLTDLDLPSFSLSKMMNNVEYRINFVSESNKSAHKIANFIAEILQNLNMIESGVDHVGE